MARADLLCELIKYGLNNDNISFRKAAEQVLTDRVNNADPAKGEARWLPGWKNRITIY